MSKKVICLRCEGKLKFDHDCKFKWLAVLLVNQDRFDDDIILIVSDQKQKRREVNLLDKSGTDFVEMGVFDKKAVDFDN